MKAYRIRDWGEHFETSESRKRKGPLAWVALPIAHDGKRFRRVARHEDGPAIFAAWCLILEIAAKCPTRGLLVDARHHPLDADDMADMTGFSESIFEKALEVLAGDRIGWIEQVELTDEPASPAPRPEKPADSPQLPASHSNGQHAMLRSAGAPATSSPTEPNRTETETEQDRTGQDRTRQPAAVAGGHAAAPSASASDLDSIGDVSDSDSMERSRARQIFLAGVIPLIERQPDKKQRKSDCTSAENLFDDVVWPDDLAAAAGIPRAQKAMESIDQAKRADRPMAFLTTMIKRAFDSAPHGMRFPPKTVSLTPREVWNRATRSFTFGGETFPKQEVGHSPQGLRLASTREVWVPADRIAEVVIDAA